MADGRPRAAAFRQRETCGLSLLSGVITEFLCQGVASVTSLIDQADLLTATAPLELRDVALYDAGLRRRGARPFSDADTASATVRGHRRIVERAVLATPLLVLACLAWTHKNMFADGYVYLHVVQNLLAGHGPVFNAGQRVEAVTSPLWTYTLTVAGLLTPFPLTWVAAVLGIACTLGGAALALTASGRLVHQASPGTFLVPLGLVAFVALPPVWSLASTGLETGLEFLWLGGCLAFLVRWGQHENQPMSRLGLVILGMGFLVRPELTIESAVFIGVVLVNDRKTVTWRGRARVVAWALVVPLLYELFRMGFYGALFANTAVTKEAALPTPGRGIHYFSDFVGPYWLFIPIGALLIGAYYPLASTLHRRPKDRRSHMTLLAFPVAAAVNAGYIVMIGGDYIHARLFMAPFFALCAPVATVPLVRRNLVALIVVPWAMVAALTFRTTDSTPWASPAIISINGHGSFDSPSAVSTSEAHTSFLRSGPAVYVQLAGPTTMRRLTAPPASDVHQPVLATFWIGPEPYELGPNVQTFDLLGLADPLTSHLSLARRGEIAGHEKPLPTPWIAAVLTAKGASTAQLSRLQKDRPPIFTPLIPSSSGRTLRVQTAWARAALECPAIKDLRQSATTPLSVGVFVSNIVHAYARTTLRIPPQPKAAYRRFCGRGTPPQVRQVLLRH
jgi:arabinofuranosyltransferase